MPKINPPSALQNHSELIHSALELIETLIVEGCKHGHFDYSITCEAGSGMAEHRELYGEFTSDLDTEWMLWHLGTAPPVPIGVRCQPRWQELQRRRQEGRRVEREALRVSLAVAMSHPQADELAYARALLDRQLQEEWEAKRVSAPAPPARSTPPTALIQVVQKRRTPRSRPRKRRTQ